MASVRLACALSVLCVVAVVGCGDDDGAASNTVTKLIGPNGGSLELAGGAKVDIPAGALSEPTEIKITKLELDDVAPLPDNLLPAGKPFAFEPHGTLFAEPVKVELAYEPEDDDVATTVRPIKAEDENDADWRTIVGSEKDEAEKTLSFDVSSFSVMIAARPNRESGVITLPDGAVLEDSSIGGTGGDGGTAGDAGTGGTGGAIDGGGTGGGIDGGGTGGTMVLNEGPLYPDHGAQWNDYVVNDGADALSASDTACDPITDGPGYDGCIHGGERRVISVTGVSSCTGLFIDDVIGAFDWTCVPGNPVFAVSTGLRAGRHLSDLIDASTGTWRENAVTVADATETTVFTSTPAVWWNNPIVIDNDGITASETTPGTIYIVTQSVTADYSIGSSNTGFVVMPGATITPAVGEYGALFLGDPDNANPLAFNWIEGTVTGTAGVGVAGVEQRFSMLRHLTVMPPLSIGLSVPCAKSKIVDFQSYDTTSFGITLNGLECEIDRARIENAAGGVHVNQYASDAASGPNTIQNVVIEGSDTGPVSAGVAIDAQMPGNTLRAIEVYDQTGFGVQVESVDNTLTDVYVQDTSGRTVDAMTIRAARNRLDRIVIRGGERGLVLAYAGHTVRNIDVSHTVTWGIATDGARESTIANVNIAGSGGGLRLYGASRNRIWNVMIATAGTQRMGATTNIGLQTMLVNGAGDEGQRSDNVLSNVSIVNSRLTGLELQGQQSSVFQHMTIANTGHEFAPATPVAAGGRGIHFASSFIKGNTFNGLLLLNNADSGLDVRPPLNGNVNAWVEGTRFHNIAALHNGKRGYGSVVGHDIGTGIRLGELAVDVRFSGMLLLADNGIDPAQNCHVFSDSTPKTEAGLTDSSVNATCAPVGGSSATLDTSVTGYGVVGPIVVNDTENPVDGNGYALFTTLGLTDWNRFEHSMRAWGPDASAFPDSSHWGICRSDGACRIYDWSLSSTDTDLRNVVPVATNGSVLTHTFWANNQQDCEGIPATWTGTACMSTFVSNAVEVMDDGLGNDNLLCESNETCVEASNLGAYQGHGTLASAGTLSGGGVTGVTLMRYATNGR